MLPLDGYTVIDLSVGIAGAYCTKLLADGGATVIKVEPPEGDPLRRWSASGAEIKAGDDGALFSFLAVLEAQRRRRPEDADGRERAARLAGDGGCGGVVARVATRRAPTSSRPQRSTDAYPHLTVTAITPFGLEGPWADKPATEFTVQAWSGGVIGLGRGAQDRAPLFVAGQIGEWLAGAYAAAGTMAVQSGLVDVSMLETRDPLPHLLFGVLHRCPGPTVPRSAPAHDSRRRDGGRRAGGAGLRHRAAVVRPVRDDRATTSGSTRSRHCPSPSRPTSTPKQIYEWVRENTVDDILDLSTAFRIPNAPVGNGANVTSFDQFVERGTFVTNPARRVHAARPALSHHSVA